VAAPATVNGEGSVAHATGMTARSAWAFGNFREGKQGTMIRKPGDLPPVEKLPASG